MKIIFVHVYKTSGSSLKELLHRNYGDRLLEDYRGTLLKDIEDGIDRPNIDVVNPHKINEFFYQKNYKTFDLIMGHFPIAKYIHLKRVGWKFVTWLRDPMERFISHYNYSVTHHDICKFYGFYDGMPIREYVKKRGPNIASAMLGNDPNLFDFVGFQNRMLGSLVRFQKFVGSDLKDIEIKYLNRLNSHKRVLTETDLKFIRSFNSRDFELYDNMVAKFKWW